MRIQYFEKNHIFKLDTLNSSYVIGLADEGQYIGHVYYGKTIDDDDVRFLLRTGESPFVPSKNKRDTLSFLDVFPMEYSGHGTGDFRESCLKVRTAEGHSSVSLVYKTHLIFRGKKKLEGLPSTFGTENDSVTLEITCEDPVLRLEAVLSYSIFDDCDIVARSVRINNNDSKAVFLTKVLSACLDMDNREMDIITLHGSWARERRIFRRSLAKGMQGVSSFRGEGGHQEHPFLALVSKNATYDCGDAYGMSFVYSGNFTATVSVDQFDYVRAVMGINPEDFCWKLESSSTFTAPEVILAYSSEGIGGMSRAFHTVMQNHLIRGIYRDKKRPILINNWEATYFNFNTEKLLDIARDSALCGIEMLVMDDGWFGGRCDDNRALGDWFVNTEKLPGGLEYLVSEVNKLGLKFGIWFEPEMISPDSDLYRAHPDWAIAVPGRQASLSRNQYVLDMSRKEVRDYIYDRLSAILRSANIEYVKWDMNRPLSDAGSSVLPADRQGELYHRYMLGVYEMQERLISDFPHILLENCSGGGARFDPGMLHYSPQIWCSDDTDAVERLSIQEGTALVYPLSSIGAHVSVCPNHTVGRNTPFHTRAYTALAGTFGYELDITKLPQHERDEIKKQTAMYHQYNDLVRTGCYYRIASYSDNKEYDCWQVTSKNKKEAVAVFVQVLGRPNMHSRKMFLKGLDENMRYTIDIRGAASAEDMKTYTGAVLSGRTIMHAGLIIQNPWGDFESKLIHILAAE